MLREHFRQELRQLEQELLKMGERVITAVRESVGALQALDVERARHVIADDEVINGCRAEIEEKTIQLIATQQPVASDLRELIAFLDLIVNLERMGDHAKGIAQIAQMHGSQPLLKPLIDIPRMAERVCAMIEDSLQAFLTRDIDLAQAVIERDNEIDKFHERILGELLSFMLHDPEAIRRATFLIWAAHNMERIADRATNICERIRFLVNPDDKTFFHP